jgi:coatomer subunit beta'
MDPSGKLIYTKNQEVLSANLQTMQEDTTPEGTRIPISIKEMGSTEIFATALIHSPNGRFVTVVGDGEYIIYTALAWRNKSFGNGVSFAWANDSNTYAVLESRVKLRIYKNFKERGGAGMKGSGSWTIEGLHGGPLLCARGHGFVLFWDWETGDIVRRVDVEAKNVCGGYGSLRNVLSHVFVFRYSGRARVPWLLSLLRIRSTFSVSIVMHTPPSWRRAARSQTKVSKKHLT